MAATPPDPVPELLVQHLPRSLVLGIDEALTAGAERAFSAAGAMADGHLAHALGQLRHFHMNQAFHGALAASDASPTELRGNDIVVGQAGIVRLARFNIHEGFWINGRRSLRRRQLALANAAIETLVQPQLFGAPPTPTDAVAFFVSCFSGSLREQPERPMSIQIAVPDRTMRYWIFKEPLDAFVQRYEAAPELQVDEATPKLKRGVGTLGQGAATRASGP